MRCRTALTTTAAILSAAVFTTTGLGASGDWHQQHKVGSCGIVDEADQDEHEFKSGRVRIKPELDTAKVVLRYELDVNVWSTVSADLVGIAPRYRDNGDEARVLIKLKEYDIFTGNTSTLLTFDSNDYDQEQDHRFDLVELNNPTWDFANARAYWLEVTLHKTGAGGRPELGMIRFAYREE